MASELLLCPFCGCEGYRHSEMEWVACSGCGACGPSQDAEEGISAEAAWNQRALAAQPATVPEGWTIKRDANVSGVIHIFGPEGTAWSVAVGDLGRSLMLYQLADAMLAAAPQPEATKESHDV